MFNENMADNDDIIIPVCKTEHGIGVVRQRPNSDKIELGLIQPLENGKTIQGELVTIFREMNILSGFKNLQVMGLLKLQLKTIGMGGIEYLRKKLKLQN